MHNLPVACMKKKRGISKAAAEKADGKKVPPSLKAQPNRSKASSAVKPGAGPGKRSVLVEKDGFLVYTGAVRGDLKDLLDEQREDRARDVYEG